VGVGLGLGLGEKVTRTLGPVSPQVFEGVKVKTAKGLGIGTGKEE
jgi:hypothetical protein